MIWRAAALCLLAWPVAAESLPGLFAVTGIAQGDVLNIRAVPAASGDQLGSLSRNTQGVEVISLSEDGRWGMVSTRETSGWVAMRYLAREPGPEWTALQRPLHCVGAEPFWGATYDPKAQAFAFDVMGEAAARMAVNWSAPVAGRDGTLGFSLSGMGGEGFAIMRAEECSDGMSDRTRGLSVDFYVPEGSGGAGYNGCCSLSR